MWKEVSQWGLTCNSEGKLSAFQNQTMGGLSMYTEDVRQTNIPSTGIDSIAHSNDIPELSRD